jgi:hypothetical protein
MRIFPAKRRLAITGVMASLAIVSVMAASAASTSKTLSTNFTLVNLTNGANTANISYYKPDGSQWRTPEVKTFTTLGEQAIYRQYTDPTLSAGSGSVVVGGQGALGAVVQIRALNQTPTSGAYSGATAGAASVNIPLVSYQGNSLQGTTNSQIIVQNTSGTATNFAVDLINRATGTVDKTFNSPSVLQPGASFTYDLADNAVGLPANWFGSAVVRATTAGGEVTAVSNFFLGPDTMQTFNGFTNTGTRWSVPLFTSRLQNGLSSPITVQNLSGGTIPANAVTVNCVPNAASVVTTPISMSNLQAIGNTAGYSWNPADAADPHGIPTDFQGSCTVDTGTFQTVAFVQLRFIGTANAAAYEALNASSTDTTVVVPLVLKRLPNGFATAVTISNLGTAPANVTLTYKRSSDTPASVGNCDATFDQTIPVGGSIVQNHRVPNGVTNSVPQIDDGCTASLTITPKGGTTAQPIGAFVQITVITPGAPGDTYMAHDAFSIQ